MNNFYVILVIGITHVICSRVNDFLMFCGYVGVVMLVSDKY